jgi:nucleoid-associated protein YgaU
VQQTEKAVFLVYWYNQKKPEPIPVQFNPAELSFDKSVQMAELNIPGLDSPIQQFIRGQTEKLTLDLFFDTTDEGGMGAGAVSVTKYTDKIYQLVKIEAERHAPPICEFHWNDQFPGSDLSNGAPGQKPNPYGNQRRNAFRCVVESVKQKFVLFSPKGVPLRATLSVVLREYKTLEEQLEELNLMSPDRTKSHITQQGETLSRIASEHYTQPDEWRAIATANQIEDPRRLEPGLLMKIPPIR